MIVLARASPISNFYNLKLKRWVLLSWKCLTVLSIKRVLKTSHSSKASHASPPVRESKNRESFACGIRNPNKFALVESGILGIGIRNTSSDDNKSGIKYLKTGIHGIESRNLDYLGFPHMEDA